MKKPKHLQMSKKMKKQKKTRTRKKERKNTKKKMRRTTMEKVKKAKMITMKTMIKNSKRHSRLPKSKERLNRMFSMNSK